MVIICSINQRSLLAMHSCTILDVTTPESAIVRTVEMLSLIAHQYQLSAESVEHGWWVHMPKSLSSLA